jgi:hypothetical protein
LACAALSACGEAEPDRAGPVAESSGETRALEQAAEMLEEQRMPAEAADGQEQEQDTPAAE